MTIVTPDDELKEGKPIYMVLEEAPEPKTPRRVLLDYQCPKTECLRCTLKFRCYTSESLNLTYDELNKNIFHQDLGINALAEAFIKFHFVKESQKDEVPL